MRKALASLCDDAGTFVNEFGPYPLVGSIAAVELSGPDDSEQLVAAHSLGNLLFESAADHAFALTRLLREPVPTIAPWTCVRGGLEAAAICCWVLSDSIAARERIGRNFAYRHEGLSQQLKLAGATGDESSGEKILRRLEDVEAKATALGYPPIANKSGRRDGIGQRMPTITKLVGDTLGEEKLYRILSAMAHGHVWALMQLGFQAPEAGKPTLLKKTMNSDAAAVLLMTAADVLAKPLWAEARLFGYDLQRLKALLDRGYREMGLNETRHFWANGQLC
jgi:hypothetical protein